MKYKEVVERNVGVQDGCLPVEIAKIGWPAAGRKVSGSSLVRK